ncbi:hypothetical protein LCGC14_1494170 [marine sediment metagenome]|uniref:Uncharacterized protein n=1 Tax=marine sediment metagenome TaxID=412755 RepID=A0A0F9LLD5_9ZZZZ
MIGDDDLYREFAERCSELNDFKILDADRNLTIICDGHEISVNHLAWLQIMGLYETWDIL